MRFLHTTTFTKSKQSSLLPILLLFLLFNSVQAQLLLKNIDGGAANSDPNGFIEMGDYVFFIANTAANGKELWRSDGTEAGTFMLKDINDGSADSNIDDMTVMNDKLYFVAYDGGGGGNFGRELWVTDGTVVGTEVIDIHGGTGSSNPDELVVMNNMLYFAATNGTDGEELWKSDGTLPNTSQVKDINGASPGSSNPAELTYYNNAIYFRANDGVTGSELWKSDGTSAGTVLLSDINTSTGSSPGKFTIANGLLFFTANGPQGQELYYTNGTGSNLIDINPSGDSNPSEMIDFDGKLYFSASDASGVKKLWTADGMTTETHVTDVTNPTNLFGWNTKLYLAENGNMRIITGATKEAVSSVDDPSAFTVYNNRVFFVNDATTNTIWMSDGTVDGTQMAMDVDVMPTVGKFELAVAGNHLYFALNDATNGSEVNFIGDCDPNRPGTTMTMVKEAGLHNSLFETIDAGNWTHYCDCTNKILLSLNKTGTGAVIPSDGVSIKIGNPLATYYDGATPNGGEDCTGCFITAEYGAVVFNRSWDVQPSTPPTSDVPVRFYFAEEDYDALQFEMNVVFFEQLSDPNQMSFFKVTDEGLGEHPAIPSIPAGDAVVLTHGTTPGLTTWKKETYISTSDFYSEFHVSSFSGGGGGSGYAGEALPVELTYFRAEPILPDNEVALEWATASELNNYGFFIERSFDSRNWQIVGFVKGTEKDVFPAVYNFVDKDPQAGDNYYRLRQRDFDGKEDMSAVVHVSMDLFIVGNIFPNPVTVNSEVMIDITTPVSSDATIEVFDLNRQLLIQNEHDLSEGPQLIPLDLSGVPAGMYIVKVESQGVVVNTRLLVQE